MSTVTAEQTARIEDVLSRTTLCQGLGTTKNPDAAKVDACSIAAINLALNGRLTDEIPECMSRVIGRWVIRVQDRMPAELRNSPEWRQALVLAAGTGRDHEQERLDLILSWMYDCLARLTDRLPASAQPAWTAMCTQRTEAACLKAQQACRKYATAYAATAAAYAADAAYAAYAATAATAAAYAADAAADAAEFWVAADPAGLLTTLTAVSG